MQLSSLSFKERAGVRMGLNGGLAIPIPALILPSKGRNVLIDHVGKDRLLQHDPAAKEPYDPNSVGGRQ
jgi:hypothetical protein